MILWRSTFVEKAVPARLSRWRDHGNACHFSAACFLPNSQTSIRGKIQLDKDFIVSVLEASATKRDAKSYLQKYNQISNSKQPGEKLGTENEAVQPAILSRGPGFVQGQPPTSSSLWTDRIPLYIALVKIRRLHTVNEQTLSGLAKTLSQLKTLGLLSVVIVDGGDGCRELTREQAWRLSYAVGKFSAPGAMTLDRLVRNPAIQSQKDNISPFFWVDAVVAFPDLIESVLRRGIIPVIPAIVDNGGVANARNQSRQILIALLKYFSGLQFPIPGQQGDRITNSSNPRQVASVERIIILDPAGGIPTDNQSRSRHRFINLEQEYGGILERLKQSTSTVPGSAAHAENLELAKDALSLLPPTSSAIITTPSAAANIRPPSDGTRSSLDSASRFIGAVKTRSVQNPLIHNLLTDKPVYSSSLPLDQGELADRDLSSKARENTMATLIKRGVPITIFPDPLAVPWKPPSSTSPRLRLTDTCIDLPRLIHLIEDSFGRKLDVKDYLDRVDKNLAGVIVAGEYEGGAILTWEKPSGDDGQFSSGNGRIVPYLDKFAVLKSRQGSGGVADVVFNAMVRDCFPNGVCWRSRVNNPVNKWYFERSTGTLRLSDDKWTMFWTTPNLSHERFLDYEDVCKAIEPSWLDNKHIVD